jgi:pimeloyl-ACP methyl ester carboxylesterase
VTARHAIPLVLAIVTGCATFQEGRVDFGVPDDQYFVTDRGRMYVLDRGEGPAVLLVHGYGSSHDVYLGLIDELVETGHRVLAVDLPGFGRSDRLPGDYTPAGLASLLATLLDDRGIDRADVVAHSWGCSIALRLALDHRDRVNRLVLTSAWVYEEQVPPFLRWSRARGVGEALFTLFYRERAADRYEMSWYDPERFVVQDHIDAVERSLRRPGTARAALEAARGQRFEEIEARYHEVHAETLIVWGRQDAVASLDSGERLEQDLPRSRLVVLERCGHVPMMERADRYNAEVLAFLDPAPAPAPAPAPVPPPAPAPAPAPEPPHPDPLPVGCLLITSHPPHGGPGPPRE